MGTRDSRKTRKSTFFNAFFQVSAVDGWSHLRLGFLLNSVHSVVFVEGDGALGHAVFGWGPVSRRGPGFLARPSGATAVTACVADNAAGLACKGRKSMLNPVTCQEFVTTAPARGGRDKHQPTIHRAGNRSVWNARRRDRRHQVQSTNELCDGSVFHTGAKPRKIRPYFFFSSCNFFD